MLDVHILARHHLCSECQWYDAENESRPCRVSAPAKALLLRGETVRACMSFRGHEGRRPLTEG